MDEHEHTVQSLQPIIEAKKFPDIGNRVIAWQHRRAIAKTHTEQSRSGKPSNGKENS